MSYVALKGACLSVLRVLRGQQQQLLLLLHCDVAGPVERKQKEHAGGRDALRQKIRGQMTDDRLNSACEVTAKLPGRRGSGLSVSLGRV